jgi:hypothetical protein
VHNVVSQAFVPEYAPNPLAYPAALRAGLWERRWYRADHFAAIGALSKRDLSYLESFRQKPKLLLLPPGMPPCLELDPEAMLRKELVIQGTFDWFPKRRDVIRFARDYMAMNQRLPILADSLPPEATRLLQPSGIPSTTDMHRFIRFGVITDRFVAGHKLKTMAYIASNMIVLSLADVSFDFSHIPDHDFFIRKINSVAEIPYHVDAVADLPVASLRMRFSRFQEACARDFSWHRVAASLLDACASLTSGNCSDQIGSASTRT